MYRRAAQRPRRLQRGDGGLPAAEQRCLRLRRQAERPAGEGAGEWGGRRLGARSGAKGVLLGRVEVGVEVGTRLRLRLTERAPYQQDALQTAPARRLPLSQAAEQCQQRAF